MNEAQQIMSGTGVGEIVAENQNDNDIVEMAGDLLGVIANQHQLPVDFDGCAISIIRDPETKALKAVILSPVDMHGDEPFPRYQVNPTNLPAAKAPKIILPV